MKLLSYRRQGVSSIGVVIGYNVLDLREAAKNHIGGAFTDVTMDKISDMISFLSLGEDGIREARKSVEKVIEQVGTVQDFKSLNSLEEIHIEAPIPHPKKGIVCLGLNYADHVREAGKEAQGSENLPQHPIYFTKAPTTVTGPFDDIVYPRITEKLDYEVELALIIGKEGKYIPEDEVYDHIAGYSVFNDVSARDLQMNHLQWFRGKSCDTFSPMGPYLVTFDEIADPHRLDIGYTVNGETRQSSNTSKMIFDIKNIVSTLSAGMTLEFGDIIATGTPSGVGSAHPSGFLNVGNSSSAQ
jgi:2-keto-4-pentenoate hydratase/2-oxohepta-3-ene-1,7-dioic acid hydratase in catechol pathway